MLPALLLLSVCLQPLLAQAQAEDDESRARELFQNGVILYEEAQYEDAIIAWREAYRLSEAPVLLFNISDAWERLGNLEEALSFLNRYRALAPADERETLDRRIRNLERRLAAEEERAREEAERRAALEAEERAREEARRASEEEAPAAVIATPPQAESRGKGRLAAQIVFATLAVGAVGSGTAFALRARSKGNELSDICPGSVCGPGASGVQDDERQAALLADISFGTAILATGALLVTTFAFRDRDAPTGSATLTSERVSRPELTPVAGPGQAGLELRVRFR